MLVFFKTAIAFKQFLDGRYINENASRNILNKIGQQHVRSSLNDGSWVHVIFASDHGQEITQKISTQVAWETYK